MARVKISKTGANKNGARLGAVRRIIPVPILREYPSRSREFVEKSGEGSRNGNATLQYLLGALSLDQLLNCLTQGFLSSGHLLISGIHGGLTLVVAYRELGAMLDE